MTLLADQYSKIVFELKERLGDDSLAYEAGRCVLSGLNCGFPLGDCTRTTETIYSKLFGNMFRNDFEQGINTAQVVIKEVTGDCNE